MQFFKHLTDPALKRLYKFVLKRMIGRFLAADELDLDQLDVHLRSGRLELCDLLLNADVLNTELCKAHGLPFKVKKGYLGSVHVSISYANIMSESCLVEIDDIEIVLVPLDESESLQTKSSSSFEAKKETIITQETNNQEKKRVPPEAVDEISQEGLDFVASWIEQVTSKIKVTLSNICLRLETGQQHNGRDIALQCKLEWAQFTDESASEVQSMYGRSDFEPSTGLYGAQSKMQGSMAASTLFGISQKGIKFRGMSMDLHLSSIEEDEETRWTERRRTEYTDMVLHPFLASDSSIPCYIQVKLSHYETFEAPAMDADVFIHSIQIVLQPQYFSELGKIADAFLTDPTKPKALNLEDNYTSAMYKSICDDRPDWMTQNDENEAAERDDGALSLSFREFQRIEQLLAQYRRTQLDLQIAHRSRESRIIDTDEKQSLNMRKLSAASVESVGLSDLEDEEDAFYECESGLASSIAPGASLNAMSQSFYASARYSFDDNDLRGVRSQVLAQNRRVQMRVKVHLLECLCVLLYDDLPNVSDEEHDEFENSDEEQNRAEDGCVRERTKSLPSVDGLERLELLFKDVILTNLVYSQSSVLSFTIGKFTLTEKTLPRMSLDTEEEEAAMLSTCLLQCNEISPVSGRKAANLSVQMRLDYEPRAEDGAPASLSSLGVKINVQPVLVELDMYLLDRAHRLIALLEDDPSVSKRKAVPTIEFETKAEEYAKTLDVTTDTVEVTLRFPMITSDRIRFGPSSKRGLCEDRLVVTLERVKVSSYDLHADDGASRPMPSHFRKMASLPWMAEFHASFEKASVSLLTPENGNQRSCSLENVLVFTACSDERCEDVCTFRLRLQMPSQDEMKAAMESQQNLSQDASQNPESAGLSRSMDDVSGDDNDGGRVGLNGWDLEALERAESFERAATAASLYAVDMSLPCANATLMKSSLDRLLVLFDALLMIDPIDVDTYNQKLELTTLRHRLMPSYLSFNLILDQGTLRISDYVSIHEEMDDTSLFTCYFVYETLKIFQVSQYMGQLVSRVHLVAQNMTLLEQNGRSNPIVPVLYRTPFGVSNAPLLFMGVDITDQTSEMRDMKVEVHVSHVSLRYDVRSKWLVRMLEMMLMVYPVPIIPLDSASMSDEECVTLLRGKNEGQDDVVPLPIAPKTVFTKLFVNFYDVLIDYAPMSLTSRAILVLGKVSVSSNVVTGAVMQGYKVSIGDLELFLTHARTEYDEINAVVLGNELFLCDASKKRKKHALQFGNLDGKYPSLLTFFETFGFLQLVTMDFVDLFVRVLDPGAVSKARGHLEEKAVSRASPELSVELNLGTANIYACFDSFNTLIELVSTWTDQLVTEQKPRDTTAYVGLETGKESPSSVSVVTNLSPVLSSSLQPLGTVTEVGARGLDLSHTSSVRSDRHLVRHENGGAVNILDEIDADAFGSGTKLFPGKTVATDTEARLLRTRMDSIQKEKKRMVSGLEREDVGEVRSRNECEERQHVAKPVRINELVIEDYYSKTRTVDDEESPGAFLMEPEPTADATATDDPWFASASPEKGAMLYKEETARWLESHTTRSVNGEREARDELTLFEPVEEEHESLPDDTTYDDDALTTSSFPMTAFPATSKNWWGMQHGLEEVELSDLQTEETASSFSHHVEMADKPSGGARDNDDAARHATMSMSVINAHDGECEEIELDFAPDRALQSHFHRLLDMASSHEEDECESMGDSSVLEQRDNDEGGGGNLKTRQASFSSTSSSHVGAPCASFGNSSASPSDQPTARWYYDETWDATSASPTGPPSRIYPHHVEIPIGGSATSLSFGEKECREAIRSLGRENAARKVDAPSPLVIQHVLLRNFNVCMRFFGGYDWTRDVSDVGRLPAVEAKQAKQPAKDMATTKKEKLVDALLDDYVPSNGGHVAAGSEPSSGLFASGPSASTMSYRKRERSGSECTRKRALKSGRKTEEMLELVVTRIQVRLDLFDDAEAQSLASHMVLALGDIELLDYISTSQIRKIVCYWKSEVAHPRESGSAMVRVQVMTVRPGAKLCEEHRLRARLLPLRINLDQEVVKFLRQFVPMEDEASPLKPTTPPTRDEEEDPRHERGIEMHWMGATASGVETEGQPLSAWFFQSIDIKPCKIKIDYRPNQVNYAALRAGDYLEVINLFVLEGMELVLRRVQASGLNGWLALCEHVLVSWIQDISRHQIHKCVASVSMPPFRPFVNIGAGAADLILLPMQHYGRDRRLVRGLKKGASSFLKSVTIETLNTASKVAQGTQALLEHADDVVSSSSTVRRKHLKYRQAGSRIARNSRRFGGGGIRHAHDAGGGIAGRHYLAQQPATAAEGFGQAYDSLARELHVAAKTIVAVPLVEYKKTGSQGYVRSVIRAVPVAVLRPMIGASEAVAKALIGVRNAVDPELKEDIENKFKDFRAI